ncbi:hypothetical protein K461DRAFT_272262 [Myriangium duriaei CBS 260.36]|uniref:Uncharacterized protein n=1 Tax=Myriangium duriaei CBS 260.36 TaxID=1168546 RepID=A0A9P4MHP5_9PEZI|nr:hypothetical protein K461DRAFT_272262 [Myriangium duriaei CBS 260.36]
MSMPKFHTTPPAFMDSIHGLKSWTILPRSLRILPPKLDDLDVDGAGQAHGSLCPGHFIPTKTKHWNKVLNRDGPLPYPGDMGLIRQEQWHMSWQFSNGHNLGISAKAGAPVVGPVPVTVNGEAEIAFKKTVTDAYRFDKLETYIIEPIEPYIGQSLKHPGIDTYIKDNTNMLGHWNVFMVTGVIVARGATMSSDETRTRQFGLGGGAGVPGVAEASAKIDIGANRQLSTSAGKINDFIWAIQLARVRKGFGRKTWDWETLWFKKSDG